MNQIIKRYIRRIASIIVSFFILFLIIWYLVRNADVLSSLSNLRVDNIFIIALMQPLFVVLGGVINKLILDAVGYSVSLKDNILLQFVNNLLNKIFAEGGAVYRGGYLKTIYSLPVSKFLVSIGGGYIITLLVNSTIGLIISIIIFIKSNILNVYILSMFVITILTTLFLIIFSPKINRRSWFFDHINRIMEGWGKIKKNHKLIFSIITLTMMITLIQSLRVFILYRGLGISISFINTIMYGSLTTFSNFINITPESIGITESLLLFSSKVLGLSSDKILLGSLLLRGVNLISSGISGVFCYIILQINLAKKSSMTSD